ncbi:hypothetical protein [Methanosarcina barkeri]|nr:hypothetical protein [Methanosarcina barkeri]
MTPWLWYPRVLESGICLPATSTNSRFCMFLITSSMNSICS